MRGQCGGQIKIIRRGQFVFGQIKHQQAGFGTGSQNHHRDSVALHRGTGAHNFLHHRCGAKEHFFLEGERLRDGGKANRAKPMRISKGFGLGQCFAGDSRDMCPATKTFNIDNQIIQPIGRGPI